MPAGVSKSSVRFPAPVLKIRHSLSPLPEGTERGPRRRHRHRYVVIDSAGAVMPVTRA